MAPVFAIPYSTLASSGASVCPRRTIFATPYSTLGPGRNLTKWAPPVFAIPYMSLGIIWCREGVGRILERGRDFGLIRLGSVESSRGVAIWGLIRFGVGRILERGRSNPREGSLDPNPREGSLEWDPRPESSGSAKARIRDPCRGLGLIGEKYARRRGETMLREKMHGAEAGRRSRIYFGAAEGDPEETGPEKCTAPR